MVGRLHSNMVIRYFLMLDRIYYTKHGPTAGTQNTRQRAASHLYHYVPCCLSIFRDHAMEGT